MKTQSNKLITKPLYANIPPLHLPPSAVLDNAILTTASRPEDDIWNTPEPPAHPVRNMSPQALAELALELYLEERIDREEYLLLGFPSETHPDYNRTIGALTGHAARPNKPRDLIRQWERRLYEINTSSAPLTVMRKRAQTILGLLRWLEYPALGKVSTCP